MKCKTCGNTYRETAVYLDCGDPEPEWIEVGPVVGGYLPSFGECVLCYLSERSSSDDPKGIYEIKHFAQPIPSVRP